MRLDSITVTRAGNGFIVRQSKSHPSDKRVWTSYTKLFLDDREAAEYIEDLLAKWKPADREGS